MISGRLNKYITVEKLTSKVNEFGEETAVYETKYRTRADVVNDSGNRITENGEIFFSYNKTFILWYYHSKLITEVDRILYDGKYYRILTLEPVKENKMLYVKTELINE